MLRKEWHWRWRGLPTGGTEVQATVGTRGKITGLLVTDPSTGGRGGGGHRGARK